jgi:hypothetical protein
VDLDRFIRKKLKKMKWKLREADSADSSDDLGVTELNPSKRGRKKTLYVDPRIPDMYPLHIGVIKMRDATLPLCTITATTLLCFWQGRNKILKKYILEQGSRQMVCCLNFPPPPQQTQPRFKWHPLCLGSA